MNITGVVSNVCINRLMASYCNGAVAGIGIAKKVDMLSYSIATGLSQGVIPLIGYNYSAKNHKRMLAAVCVFLPLWKTLRQELANAAQPE